MKQVIRLSLVVFAFVGVAAGVLLLLGVSATDLLSLVLRVDRIEFAYPWLLLSLVAVVPLAVTAVTRPSRRVVGAMVYTRGDLLQGAPRTLRNVLPPLLPLLHVMGLVSLCLAAARPQTAVIEELEVEGIDIYVILDMSGSMQAIDLSEAEVAELQARGESPPNRFILAREVLKDFVQRRADKLWSDRIGMVIFARKAFLQFPLTVDYATVLWLLDRLQLNDIDPSQTAIGNALGLAISGLIDADSESKVIVLITDGDERGGNMSAVSAARVAADQGIKVFPILVGREGPVLVPEERVYGFGVRYQVQEYPVDPDLLREVAAISDGRFFRAENKEELETTLEEIIGEFERDQFEEILHHQRIDIFYPFVWGGFLLIGLELFLAYGVMRKFP